MTEPVRRNRIPEPTRIADTELRKYLHSVIRELGFSFDDIATTFNQIVEEGLETRLIILTSPNGTRYQVEIDDAGVLTSTAI